MKKQFLNLGKALNKAEQKQIYGGYDQEFCGGDMGDYNYASGCGCVSGNDCIMGTCEKPFNRGAVWGICA